MQRGLTPCVITSLKSHVKVHDTTFDVDVILTGAVLKTNRHMILDLAKSEKE
jgi:hypothetical protein